MAVCLLVGLLLWDQATHDDFHPGADRIYRVVMETEDGRTWAATPAGIAPALRANVAGVEAATQLRRVDGGVMVEGRRFSVQGYYAEPSFFDVFGFELTADREADALAAPGSAVITQDLAQRLYGNADPIGQTLVTSDTTAVTVTGVIDQDAYRSHLTFDVLYAFGAARKDEQAPLGTDYAYLRLGEGLAPADVAPSLRHVKERYLPEDVPGASPERFQLQSVSDIPLSGRQLTFENARGMLPPSVAYFLGACALLVIMAAGFNYINLSVARSLARAREVGVRKALGAHRRHVMGPFLAEAIVVALGALALGAFFLQGLVPVFNGLSVVAQMGVPIEIEPGLRFYGVFVLFAIGVGGLAGLYPAWHLSAFQPARVLKSSRQSEPSGFRWVTPRKVLTVLQFAGALVVIVTAVLLYRQVTHMSAAEASAIPTDRFLHVNLQGLPYVPFQQQARQLRGVEQVGAASHVPLGGVRTVGVSVTSPRTADSVEARSYAIDYEFTQVLDLPLVAAEDWSEARFETGRAVLISETAARRLGFETPQAALGESLTLTRMRSVQDVQVAGVVRDLYLSFMEGPNHPVVSQYDPSRFRIAMVQVADGQEEAVHEALTAVWSRLSAGGPLQARSYRALIASTSAVAPLRDAGWVLGLVAALAALISGLGLLGIATHEVQTRTREIGIRKALGASVTSVVRLLSTDALRLVGAAILLGLPVAWWINRIWLQGFAYRIDLDPWTFALGSAAIAGLALLALAPQALRAARTDPAETLREE
jgi:putative ABC transport system permease protein